MKLYNHFFENIEEFKIDTEEQTVDIRPKI